MFGSAGTRCPVDEVGHQQPLWPSPSLTPTPGCLDYVWVSRGNHWAVSATLDMPYRYGRDPRTDVVDEIRQEEGPASAAPGLNGPPPLASGEEGHGHAYEGDGGQAHEAVLSAAAGGLGMAGRPPVWRLRPLPDAEWPSDHLAVGAELRLLKA